jgi:hypothetical protein
MEKQITFKQYGRFAELVDELEKLRTEIQLAKANNKHGTDRNTEDI